MNTKENTTISKFVNAQEVARALGLTVAGIYNLIKQGKFPAGIKIGNSRRWDVQAVNEWLNNRKEVELCAN